MEIEFERVAGFLDGADGFENPQIRSAGFLFDFTENGNCAFVERLQFGRKIEAKGVEQSSEEFVLGLLDGSGLSGFLQAIAEDEI